ncbi:aldose 1-epimerase family protein [Pseudomonas trivialis]|uniref:aldose 1-epimerase family protein n=1 Tax=Pseudomonas trivialis TaxID=200450 RepID=UPI0030CA64D5
MSTRIPLYPALFGEQENIILQSQAFKVSAWTYPSGVRALSLENSRGRLVLLPYQGQMIWSAVFDGCDLTMRNLFEQPRPSPTIIDTYGCFMFHSGLLRNGCPAPQDTHALHGEMPCAPMDTAWLELGEDCVSLNGSYEYAKGFGDRYRACPRVTLHADSALFDIGMAVTNLAGKPMDLMYMAHMNYAYVAGARFVEPLGMQRQRLRTSVPDHVKPTPAWSAYMAQLVEHPAQLASLDQPSLYDPEVVFFFDGVGTDAAGQAHFLLDHPDGAAFYTRYRPEQFERAVRWILYTPDQQVAAFVLPSTCEPEGYNAEKAKGNVRVLAAGASASFSLTTGYLSAQERQTVLG